jgi:hypothetical protein
MRLPAASRSARTNAADSRISLEIKAIDIIAPVHGKQALIKDGIAEAQSPQSKPNEQELRLL